MQLQDYGYVRVATAVPQVYLADPVANAAEIIRLYEQAKLSQVEVLVFPELTTTGYSCGELFNQDLLLNASNHALEEIAAATADSAMLVVVGAPFVLNNRLFNVAVVMQQGEILAIVPKSHLPNTREFYEARWFSRAEEINDSFVCWHGRQVPIDENILLVDQASDLKIAIEICEDMWVPNAPSIRHAQRGANLILNLSSSPETVGKSALRRRLVQGHSINQIVAYAYASSSHTDSTSDVIFSGHCLIAEKGDILYEDRFMQHGQLGWADIDYDGLQLERLRSHSFAHVNADYRLIGFSRDDDSRTLSRKVEPFPFLPTQEIDSYYQDVLMLQALGLSQRLIKTGIRNSHIGLSGGLDSTWALIVIKTAHEMAGLPLEHIKAIIMPGFGTTDDTKQQAKDLAQAIGIPLREIDITKSVLQHFEDIGHDPADTKLVYENAQARERTQILMDLSNKEHGLVVGTGDLSENALGWSTYNGDHMSMYSVNASLPKSLIRAITKWYADRSDDQLKQVLYDILQTPISPELLPPDSSGQIAQKTEDIIGDYALNDFFLYHVVASGYQPFKIVKLAELAFDEVYSRAELIEGLKNFYRRFITNQFKRNAAPDAPKITSIGLGGRSDFKLVSDARYDLWLKQLEEMEV